MPLDTFPLLQDNTRLIRYNDTLFKLKIKYDTNTAYDKQLNERAVHHELEQVVRAVLYKNERNSPLKPIVTPSFLVKPFKIPWSFPVKNKNYKFTLYGKTLKVYEFLFEFHVSKNNVDESAIHEDENTAKHSTTVRDIQETAEGSKKRHTGIVNGEEERSQSCNKAQHSAIVTETVEGRSKVCTDKEGFEPSDDDNGFEESRVKRTLRYHRGKDGNLYRESTKRGKSPVLGEKRVKRCNNNVKAEDDAGEMTTDEKDMVEEVEILDSPERPSHRRVSKRHLDQENDTVEIKIPDSPVRPNHRRASKRHLDHEKVGKSATVSRQNNAQKIADRNNSEVNKVSLQNRQTTADSRGVTKKAKHSKFSLKATELASLGTVQESRLRNRNRVQSGISNRRTSRSSRMLPRQIRRFSEKRKMSQGRIRTKVSSVESASDLETGNDSESEAEGAVVAVESNHSDSEDFNCNEKMTRNNPGKRYHDKTRNENAKTKDNQKRKYVDKHVFTRRSRRFRSTKNQGSSRRLSSVSSTEDTSAERNSSCCDSSTDTRSPRRTQRRSTAASTESDSSPNKQRYSARNMAEERSNKRNISKKVRLYAARNSPHAIGESGHGVTEITSPRVSAVRPFKHITPVKGAEHTISQNILKLSPRRTRQSLHDGESQVVRSQVPSQVYTDMMLTRGKDDQQTQPGKMELNRGQQITEPSKLRQSPRNHSKKQRQSPRDLSVKQRQSPSLVAAGNNKRRSSGIWGKIAGFMFGK